MATTFVKVSTVYPAFRDALLAGGAADRPYDELHRMLVESRHALSDAYAHNLRALGYDAHELFALDIITDAWRREHPDVVPRDGDVFDVVTAQVLALDPDVVMLQDLFFFDADRRARLRDRLGRGVPVIAYHSTITRDPTEFRDLDLVLTSTPALLAAFREVGVEAAMLPHAFDVRVLEHTTAVPRDLAFTFVGSVGSPTDHHDLRYELVGHLLEVTPLVVLGSATVGARWRQAARRGLYRMDRMLGTAGVDPTVRGRLPLLRRAAGLDERILRPHLTEMYAGRLLPPVFGLDYFRALARSRVTLNKHAAVAGGYVANMRLFEATGMGACLLTDRQRDLGDYFEPEVEVATYATPQECVARARELVAEPEQAATIAAAGRRRTLRDHTFERRMGRLDAILHERL